MSGGDVSDFLYFSFTTMTTTGFGDLTAAHDFGRSLAIIEALIGQIYLVTLVALIVEQPGPAQRAPVSRGRTASPRDRAAPPDRPASAIAALALVAGARSSGPAADGGGEADPPAAASEQVACPRRDRRRARGRLAGQMLIVRMEVDGDRRAARAGSPPARSAASSCFPRRGPTRTRSAPRSRNCAAPRERAAAPAPLVAIDQEGGDVERLPSLPPEAPATAIGAAGPPAPAPRAQATGTALAGLGIDIDLAPVLDLAGPALGLARLRRRSGRGRRARDRVRGRAPGRWRRGDREALPRPGVRVDEHRRRGERRSSSPTRARARARAVPSGGAAGVDLVMVANATYPALDPHGRRPSRARVIEGLLRSGWATRAS